MDAYDHEEALRAWAPAPVVDHKAWAERPAGNKSHHELLARQRRASYVKVFQMPPIEFEVRCRRRIFAFCPVAVTRLCQYQGVAVPANLICTAP